jgi:hypothetical protein
MKRIISLATAGAIALSGASFVGVAAASADTTTTTVAPTTTTSGPTTTTTLGPPIQGLGPLSVYLNVDTVVGSRAAPGVTPAVGCAMTSQFLIGQMVVFRMSGVNVAAGGTPLTPKNVISANVVIPGVTAPVPMAYGNHGTVAFWTAGWSTVGYPTLGVVNFQIVVKTAAVKAVTQRYKARIVVNKKVHYVWRTRLIKPAVGVKTFTYTQAGTAVTSQLTLNAAPKA